MANNLLICTALCKSSAKMLWATKKKEYEWKHFKDTIIILEFIKDYSMLNFNWIAWKCLAGINNNKYWKALIRGTTNLRANVIYTCLLYLHCMLCFHSSACSCWLFFYFVFRLPFFVTCFSPLCLFVLYLSSPGFYVFGRASPTISAPFAAA